MKANNSHTPWVLGSTLLLCCIIAPLSEATPIFSSQGFESPTYSPGTLSGQDGWIGFAPSDPSDEPEIQTSTVFAGSQAGSVIRNSLQMNSIELVRDFTPSAGLIQVQLQMRIQDMAAGTENFDALYVYKDAFGGGGNRATILFFKGDNTITVFNGGSEQVVDNWTVDTWHALDFVFNTGSQTFDLSIDGSQVADDFDFLEAGATQIGGIAFQENGAKQNGGFTLDNVLVQAVPEPSTRVLLLTGVLGLMYRRRIFRR